jgi:hypothetical protein
MLMGAAVRSQAAAQRLKPVCCRATNLLPACSTIIKPLGYLTYAAYDSCSAHRSPHCSFHQVALVRPTEQPWQRLRGRCKHTRPMCNTWGTERSRRQHPPRTPAWPQARHRSRPWTWPRASGAQGPAPAGSAKGSKTAKQGSANLFARCSWGIVPSAVAGCPQLWRLRPRGSAAALPMSAWACCRAQSDW